MPLPEFAPNKKTETFYSFESNLENNQQQSLCHDYDSGCFKFSSFDINIDENIIHITRKYDTIMSIVKEIGAIKVGAVFVLSIFTASYTKYTRDRAVAEAFFYENTSRPNARSEKELALQNLRYRQKFKYPAFFYNWCKRH